MKKFLAACLALLMMVSLTGCGGKVEMDLVSWTYGDNTYYTSQITALTGEATFDSKFKEGTISISLSGDTLTYKISDQKFYKTTDSGNQMYEYKVTSDDGSSTTGYGIVGESGGKATITVGFVSGETTMFYYKEK